MASLTIHMYNTCMSGKEGYICMYVDKDQKLVCTYICRTDRPHPPLFFFSFRFHIQDFFFLIFSNKKSGGYCLRPPSSPLREASLTKENDNTQKASPLLSIQTSGRRGKSKSTMCFPMFGKGTPHPLLQTYLLFFSHFLCSEGRNSLPQ